VTAKEDPQFPEVSAMSYEDPGVSGRVPAVRLCPPDAHRGEGEEQDAHKVLDRHTLPELALYPLCHRVDGGREKIGLVEIHRE
jgi:hypothetical protein